ncbi:MAG: transposase [Spirochaetota bacterium]|nr:transposase [Spirochaetota bacterium]
MNKSRKLIEFIEKQNIRIDLYYLPVYSPNLNLIERLWRFKKKKLLSNKYYASFTRFRNVIEDFFNRRIHRMKKDLTRLMTPNFELFS